MGGKLIISGDSFADTIQPEVTDFPLLGSYALGGTQNYNDADVRAALAKRHVNIYAHYPGWRNSKAGGTDISVTCQAVKALSTIGTKMFPYIMYVDILDNFQNVGQANYEQWQRLEAEDQFCYTNNLTKTTRVAGSESGYTKANYGTHQPVGSDGKRWINWIIEWYMKLNKDGGTFTNGSFNLTTLANPHIDGLFIDNMFYEERNQGDWNCDGTSDGTNNSAIMRARIQNYHKNAVQIIRSLAPGYKVLANSADWGDSVRLRSEPITGGPLDQLVEGGVIEHIRNYETSVNFQTALNAINVQMDAFKAPKYGVLEVDIGSLTDYKTMRYWNCIANLTSTYYYPHADNDGYRSQDLPLTWFNEWDFNLGQKIGTYTRFHSGGSDGSGVYVQEFENGYSIVGAKKGTGVAASSDNTPYPAISITGRRLSGTQAPTVNSGAQVTSVTMVPNDGLVLQKL